jgi:hypothetical protein
MAASRGIDAPAAAGESMSTKDPTLDEFLEQMAAGCAALGTPFTEEQRNLWSQIYDVARDEQQAAQREGREPQHLLKLVDKWLDLMERARAGDPAMMIEALRIAAEHVELTEELELASLTIEDLDQARQLRARALEKFDYIKNEARKMAAARLRK